MSALLSIHPASHFSLTQNLLPQPQTDSWKATAIKVGLVVFTLGLLLLGTFLYELFTYTTTPTQSSCDQSARSAGATPDARQTSPKVLIPTTPQPTLSINTADIPQKPPIIKNTCQNTSLIGRIEPQTKGSVANIQNISSWTQNATDSISSLEHQKSQVRPAHGLASRCWTWLKKHPVLPIAIALLITGGLVGLYMNQMQTIQPEEDVCDTARYWNTGFRENLSAGCHDAVVGYHGLTLDDLADLVPGKKTISANVDHYGDEVPCQVKLTPDASKRFTCTFRPNYEAVPFHLSGILPKFQHCIKNTYPCASNQTENCFNFKTYFNVDFCPGSGNLRDPVFAMRVFGQSKHSESAT